MPYLFKICANCCNSIKLLFGGLFNVSRQTTTVIRVTTWRYIGKSDPARVVALLSVVPFSDIADRVRREMNVVCCHTRDCDDSPGFARVIYCAEIGHSLFDLFFNSASGYRGAYFESPENGLAANRQLFHAVMEKLLSWSSEHCKDEDSTLIRRSLSASSAKVWVAESTLELCASCSGEWSTSHKSELEIANGRWELENHTHAKWGRQAPRFRKLRIFGGFVNYSNDEYVAPHKVHRANDIWRRGWS